MEREASLPGIEDAIVARAHAGRIVILSEVLVRADRDLRDTTLGGITRRDRYRRLARIGVTPRWWSNTNVDAAAQSSHNQ